jgi:hypothetical protein
METQSRWVVIFARIARAVGVAAMFGVFILMMYYGGTRQTVPSTARWYELDDHGRTAFLTGAEVLNMVLLGAIGALLFILGIALDPQSSQRVWRRH